MDQGAAGPSSLLGPAEHADRAGHAGSAEAAVAVRVRRQVLLVVVLGVIERTRRCDLGRDRTVSRPRASRSSKVAFTSAAAPACSSRST